MSQGQHQTKSIQLSEKFAACIGRPGKLSIPASDLSSQALPYITRFLEPAADHDDDRRARVGIDIAYDLGRYPMIVRWIDILGMNNRNKQGRSYGQGTE